jgi:hypothetical protein
MSDNNELAKDLDKASRKLAKYMASAENARLALCELMKAAAGEANKQGKVSDDVMASVIAPKKED